MKDNLTSSLKTRIDALDKSNASTQEVLSFLKEVVSLIDARKLPLHEGMYYVVSLSSYDRWYNDELLAAITGIAGELEIPATSNAAASNPQEKYEELKSLIDEYEQAPAKDN